MKINNIWVATHLDDQNKCWPKSALRVAQNSYQIHGETKHGDVHPMGRKIRQTIPLNDKKHNGNPVI